MGDSINDWLDAAASLVLDGRVPEPTGYVYLQERDKGAQWYARFTDDQGRERRRRIGPAWTGKGRPPRGSLTRKDAEAALHAALAKLKDGGSEDRTNDVPFSEAAAEWLRYVEHDRQRRRSTVADYRSVVEHNLLPVFGDRPLSAITPRRIEGYRARLVEEGRLSARSINKILVLLHGIFQRARFAYGLTANPVASVSRQPESRSGDFDVLEPIEVEALARSASCEHDAAIFTVAAFTGLRMGELRGLRWDDVDFGRRLIHVRRSVTRTTVEPPKSGRVRSVPISDQVVVALDGLTRQNVPEPASLVFPGKGGEPFDDSALRRRFYKALARAGLKRIRFHDLRHTFGTLAVQAFPLTDVRAFMGHADIQTTMIYVHHVPRHEAAEKLSRVIADDENGTAVSSRAREADLFAS